MTFTVEFVLLFNFLLFRLSKCFQEASIIFTLPLLMVVCTHVPLIM